MPVVGQSHRKAGCMTTSSNVVSNPLFVHSNRGGHSYVLKAYRGGTRCVSMQST
jgi:hypothetical protein